MSESDASVDSSVGGSICVSDKGRTDEFIESGCRTKGKIPHVRGGLDFVSVDIIYTPLERETEMISTSARLTTYWLSHVLRFSRSLERKSTYGYMRSKLWKVEAVSYSSSCIYSYRGKRKCSWPVMCGQP